MPGLEQIGDRLRRLRTEAGITQADLADATGIGRSSIANIEAGRQDTSVITWLAIARHLGATLDDLINPDPTGEPFPWIDLVTRVTASERTYTRLSQQCWADGNVQDAVKYRYLAEGLAMARDHHADVIRESKQNPPVQESNQ
jgi:transcriptional regulator with XRE-family HTH domain